MQKRIIQLLCIPRIREFLIELKKKLPSKSHFLVEGKSIYK
jgi:hypothetical protein